MKTSERIAELERRIAELEKRAPMFVVVPPYPMPQPVYIPPLITQPPYTVTCGGTTSADGFIWN